MDLRLLFSAMVSKSSPTSKKSITKTASANIGSHGYVSYLLGDPTAKNAGRLTLNPLKHLDSLGILTLILTRIIG